MPIFHVDTGRQAYPCIVERGALSRLSGFLPSHPGKIFLVSTKDVRQLYGPALDHALTGRDYEHLQLPGGEPNKRFEHIEALAEHMMHAGADRSSVVVAFGGGIVGDMGGFLAAVFMRGIPVIQVPTTLLAQVDAAIGGKTGVNLTAGKNLIGAFHQPLAVLIDTAVLKTLPEREYRAGLYEVIKYGVIASAGLFQLLQEESAAILAQEPELLERIVSESVRIKAEVVSADEREGDRRRILNFGHTIGHALEAETNYSQFLHGEAVAFGMSAAVRLAARIGLLAEAACSTILRVIDLYGPIPKLTGISAEGLVRRLGGTRNHPGKGSLRPAHRHRQRRDSFGGCGRYSPPLRLRSLHDGNYTQGHPR
ncbi:MAG: 3-dehydroquinate synthase [Bryobacteraceae bacterium]